MAVDVALLVEVEQFLYQEARLLDDHRFHEWLELFTDDVHYWVPVRESVLGGPEVAFDEDTLALAHFDDDRAMLEQRVRRLDTGLAHSETPASRTRHLISNVQVEGDGDEVVAHSSFLRREDLLRRVDGAWKIARRKVYLDHAVLPRAVSVFF
jgi:3-phenylpropionate/cinnamic acid dioxygenase small subunit